MNFAKIILLAVVGFAMSGCLSTVLPDPKPADTIYRLAEYKTAVVADADAIIVRIDRPTTPTALAGKNIVVSPDGTRLASAAKARWAEPIPTLVQLSLFDEISSRSNIVGVLPASGARTTHRLHLTVRNFEATFDQGPSSAPLAAVEYTATVADASSRNLIGTRSVRKEVRAIAPSVSSIVDAQDKANRAAIAEVVDWVATLEIDS